MPPGDERLRTVLSNRHEVLDALVAGSATKPELVAALDMARSTVDRAVRDLEEVGAVVEAGGTYAATTAGRLAAEEHARHRSATAAIHDATEFANHLPRDAPLDPCLLEGARVVFSAEHAPDQALGASATLFEQATALRGLAPVVLSVYPELIADRLERGELSVEVVAARDVVESLPDLPSPKLGQVLSAESVSLFETDADLPYALWLMETPEGTHAGVTVHDGGGVAGVLVNGAEPAVEWARAQYRQYRAGATPVAPSAVE